MSDTKTWADVWNKLPENRRPYDWCNGDGEHVHTRCAAEDFLMERCRDSKRPFVIAVRNSTGYEIACTATMDDFPLLMGSGPNLATALWHALDFIERNP